MVSTRSLLIAPRQSGALLGILTDWSALGLIDEFLWIYADTVSTDSVPVIGVGEGRFQREQLARALPSGGGVVRIVSLAPTDQIEDLAPAMDVARSVLASGPYVLKQVRAILPVAGESSWRVDAEPGWSTYVLSPEIPLGPRETSEPVEFGSASADQQAAANLAALLGLWNAVPASPVDERSDHGTLRMVRSGLRGWDGTVTDEVLKVKTLSLPSKNPTDTGDGSRLLKSDAIETPELIRMMADPLWARHRELFQHKSAPLVTMTKWGLWDAIREFLAFLVQGIWNPAQWVKAKTEAAKSKLAARVGGVLLGGDSAYELVWKTESSVPATEVGRAAAGIGAALSSQLGLPGMPARPAFSQFWREYTSGGLTLIDGADRAPNVVGRIGETPAVVGNLDAVVPKSTDVFSINDAGIDIPRHLRRIEKHDVLAQRQLANHLNRLARQGHSTPANLAAQSLERWSNAAVTSSYASRIGHRLSDAYQSSLRLVADLSEEFRSTQRESEEASLRSQSRKAGRWVRWTLVIGVVLVAVLLSLGFASLLPLAVAGILVGGVVIGALVAAMAGFVTRQRDLFRILHRRRDLQSKEQRLLEQLRLALQDLERCSQGYEQFLCWTQALRQIVHHPFGMVGEKPTAAHAPDDLPRSIQLGVKRYEPEAVEQLTAYLRHRAFQQGWLSQPWRHMLGNSHALVGHDAYELRANPGVMFEESAGEDSYLVRWTSRLCEGELRDADVVWQELRDEAGRCHPRWGLSLFDRASGQASSPTDCSGRVCG